MAPRSTTVMRSRPAQHVRINSEFLLVFDPAGWTGSSATRTVRLVSRLLSREMHGTSFVAVQLEDRSTDTREGQVVLDSFEVRAVREYLNSQKAIKAAIKAAFRQEACSKREFWTHARVNSLWIGSMGVKRVPEHHFRSKWPVRSRFVVLLSFRIRSGVRSTFSCVFQDGKLIDRRRVV